MNFFEADVVGIENLLRCYTWSERSLLHDLICCVAVILHSLLCSSYVAVLSHSTFVTLPLYYIAVMVDDQLCNCCFIAAVLNRTYAKHYFTK